MIRASGDRHRVLADAATAGLASALLAVLMIDWLHHALEWLYRDPDGYNLVSGPIPDLTLLAILGTAYKHFNCHVTGCKRWGHVVHGTSYRACNRHHPRRPDDGKITAEHIAEAKADYERPGGSARRYPPDRERAY
jgi:hypothetical protein